MGHKHKTTVEDRFWAKVNKTDTCWLWTGSTINGYGQYRANGHGLAVQFSWELHFGQLPPGRIKQTCGQNLCVRPDHLTSGPRGRFWARVDRDGPWCEWLGSNCWNWTGAVKTVNGELSYGNLYDDQGRVVPAHRFSYELEHGVVLEDELDVEHRCRNKVCVRPAHLRAATRKQNMENQPICKRNKTGHRGVILARYDDLTGTTWYGVEVGHNGKKYGGGFYTDLDLANKAAIELRNKLFTHNDEDRP